jgi:glycosyltransferase involved in cell wall biosynthesis
MQLIDSLNIGGAERVAVNIANALPQDRFESHLCTTRADGPLAAEISPHVKRLSLRRRHRFDLVAILRFVRYIRENRIELLHAHGTTVFIATISRLFCDVKVIWHDHYGNREINPLMAIAYRTILRGMEQSISVNKRLAELTRNHLAPADLSVIVLPNFVILPAQENCAATRELPGMQSQRIVFVANLRHPKDHFMLVRALWIVLQYEQAELILVGSQTDVDYTQSLNKCVAQLGVRDNVHFLGLQSDVSSILKECAIGVISSKSEGLPLALLEYGMAGLPVVSTRVGDCATVLGDGEFGLLVDPENPDQLAEAILNLLKSPQRRQELGQRFQTHVMQNYSRQAVITQLTEIYDRVLRA